MTDEETDQEPTGFVGTALRLQRLAEGLDAAAAPEGPASETAAASGISAVVEAPLAKLEQLVANLSEYGAQEMAHHAPA